ncbi:MAG: hypothetical protein LIP23_04140, partial [Planctomycetes bacterium]|nr:hypothetical protein [Planctomycetota bacterium]
HAFINHLLDPVQASRNMNNVKDYMPNPEALARISPELAANPAFTISDGALARTEMIRHLGAATSIYEEVWAKITAP